MRAYFFSALAALALTIAAAPAAHAEFIFRHRLVLSAPLVVAAAAPAEPEVPEEPRATITTNWSAADWQAFDLLNGVAGDMRAVIGVYSGTPMVMIIQTSLSQGCSLDGGEIVQFASNEVGAVPLGGSTTYTVPQWIRQPCGPEEGGLVSAPTGLPPLTVSLSVPEGFTAWGIYSLVTGLRL